MEKCLNSSLCKLGVLCFEGEPEIALASDWLRASEVLTAGGFTAGFFKRLSSLSE